MNKCEVEAIVNALAAESWALELAAQVPAREDREAYWMLAMADRLDGIAETIQAAADGPEH